GTGPPCPSKIYASRFPIPLPIGTFQPQSPPLSPLPPLLHSAISATTVVSVGPYVLINTASPLPLPSHCSHFSTPPACASSPPMIITRSACGTPTPSLSTPRTSSCQYAVGRFTTLTSHSSHCPTNLPALPSISSDLSTTVPPLAQHGNISSTL